MTALHVQDNMQNNSIISDLCSLGYVNDYNQDNIWTSWNIGGIIGICTVSAGTELIFLPVADVFGFEAYAGPKT